MADKFSIEVVTTQGSETLSDEKAEERRIRRARQQAAEARRQRTAELREERNKRARKKEEDRQQDRQERKERRKSQDEKTRIKEIEREEQRAEKEKLQSIRRQERAERMFHATRRKFINDLLGAFNNAHLGRRINHAIDSILSFSGEKKTPFDYTPTSSPESSLPGADIGRDVPTLRPETSEKSKDEKKSADDSQEKVIKVDTTESSEKLTNSFVDALGKHTKKQDQKSSPVSQKVRPPLPTIEYDPTKYLASSNIDNRTNVLYDHSKSVGYQVVTRPNKKGKSLGRGTGIVTRTRSTATSGGGGGLVSGAVSGASGVAAGSLASGATAGATGTAGVAASAGAGLGISTGVLVGGALIGGTAAAAAGLWAASKAADSFAKTIESFPSALTFAQVNSELRMFAVRMERASRFGEKLADIEESRTDLNIAWETLGDTIIGPLLGPVNQGIGLLANMLEVLNPILKLVSTFTIEPVLKILESILGGINWLVDSVQDLGSDTLGFFEEVIPFLKEVRQWLFGKAAGEEMTDMIRNLYKFLNADDQIADDTELTFGIDI